MIYNMRMWFRTSRRTGIVFPFPIILIAFLWPFFLIYAIWRFVGDKEGGAPGWVRFCVGFGFWVLFVLAVTGQLQ